MLGPTDTAARGGTVTFLMRDRDGRPIDDRRVEELANRADISLRTGCFCNPGAGEIAHRLGADEMTTWFERRRADVVPRAARRSCSTSTTSWSAAIRISVGVATNFADVYRFVCFMQRFVDRTVDEVGHGRRSRRTPTAAIRPDDSTRGGPPMKLTYGEIIDGLTATAGAAAPCSTRTRFGRRPASRWRSARWPSSTPTSTKEFVPIKVVTTFFFVDFLIRVTVGLRYSPIGVVAGR